ncbi:MAG: peptidase M23 [Halobacteriovoraceae bacterium]|nr:peptidase M23 [Halobacteriovoraceae bacterium]|tara:strand:- start:48 stop:1391 length:1344 start_codon:yes stop_codon:yes gene_type:complete
MIKDMSLKILAILVVFLCSSAFSSTGSYIQIPFLNTQVNKERVFEISGQVKSGQGLYQALKDVSIENALALEIINTLRDDVEFSKLKVGDQLKAEYNFQGELVRFTFSQNPAEKHLVKKSQGHWVYEFIEEPTFWESRIVNGELTEGSTLQGVLLEEGFSPETTNNIVSALMCKVNFRMHARVGDAFQALIQERKYKEEVIETRVLYTAYQGDRAGNHETFLYQDEEKGSTYNAHYTQDGQALIRSGLRYPLSRLHVRSGFGWRRHPVTGRRTMHRGVDLRGGVGKPVHAVAEGRVIQSTYNKYAGNKIAIRHRDGSISYYMHLNKRRVNKGAWVKTYQVIGTVGKTGRVTGPHLHFGFKRPNGRWMNPLSKRMIATPKLSGKRFEKLKVQIAQIKGLIQDLRISKESPYLLAKIPNIEFKEARFSWPDLSQVMGDELQRSPASVTL